MGVIKCGKEMCGKKNKHCLWEFGRITLVVVGFYLSLLWVQACFSFKLQTMPAPLGWLFTIGWSVLTAPTTNTPSDWPCSSLTQRVHWFPTGQPLMQIESGPLGIIHIVGFLYSLSNGWDNHKRGHPGIPPACIVQIAINALSEWHNGPGHSLPNTP